ncbi:cyclin-dependent kinase inhibitor 7-like [Diospyros lotus]|uniref:cyclin-dependent kinase inhibitor 7-like n=1 Tax=Diospyros lotus TaxID=55363 RepID=UPI002257A38E|nr:cyclin-dependent kinase inhibitor 7-like [Diospyros lotus]
MGKCKGIGGETAVTKMAHVGVRTRARVLAAAARTSAARRRKVGGSGELNFSSPLIQLRSRGRVVVTPQKTSVSPAASGNSRRQTISNSHCSSAGSDGLPHSCCSSSASSDVANNMFNVVDLEEENVPIQTSTCSFNSDERRETTASSEVQVESGDLESTARPSEANSRRRSSAAKMPSEIELEEFFAAAEKDLQKRFREKYNYDIAKDVPLEGRYEWVRLKP